MSENTAEIETVELPEYGTIELKPLSEDEISALSEIGAKSRQKVTRAIMVLRSLTNEHNLNCSTVRRAADENKSPEEHLEQIRVQNPQNDPELEKMNKRIEQILKTLDDAKAKAYEIAAKYQTAAVSVEEAEAKREKTKKSSGIIRDLRKNLQTIADVVDEDVELKGGIMSLVPEPDSLRGVKLSGSADGEAAAKFRVEGLFLNGEKIEKKFETPQGDKYKTSFSILAAHMSKLFRGHADPANKVSAVDITNAMYDHIGLARGTKQTEIKTNVIEFPFQKVWNATKNDVVTQVTTDMKIRVVFNYDQWLKDNAPAENNENVEAVA